MNVQVRLETDKETGRFLAAYFQVAQPYGETTTEEIQEGVVFADYDRKGRLIGVEVLAACETVNVPDVRKERKD